MICRSCQSEYLLDFVDLGSTPLADFFPRKRTPNPPSYPLRAFVCHNCHLVQLDNPVRPRELFPEDYGFVTGASPSAVSHFKDYAEEALGRFPEAQSVLDIASNDGTLLGFFKERGLEVQGVDPAKNAAEIAIEKGIPTHIDFFSYKLAQQLYPQKYDLVLANNVLAHVPSPLDFVKGVKEVLSPRGRAIFEFHHVPNLIFGLQFDNFYHEHFSYFSLSSISPIFEEAGLRISSVKKVNTQGGSLRIVASNRVDRVEYGVWDLLKLEEEVGLNDLDLYRGYQNRIEYARYLLREKIFELLKEGHNIYGYGASAKSNTLLHFASIDSSLLSYIVDLSPQKIGRFTPGTNIPIISPEQEKEIGRPEYYLLTVWNYLEGVLKRETLFRERGGKFVVPLPEVRIV